MESRLHACLSICMLIIATSLQLALGFQLRAAGEEEAVPKKRAQVAPKSIKVTNKQSSKKHSGYKAFKSSQEKEDNIPVPVGGKKGTKGTLTMWSARLKLHMMSKKGLEHDGAVCLDGSDAGFYFAPALKKSNRQNWQIVFEGGGWCLEEESCIPRLNSGLGTSTTWTRTYGRRSLEGFLSDDCDVNPDFCNFNRVVVAYCDGTSFTGDREDPVKAKDKFGIPVKLYFRGRRILDATFDTLFEDFGLQDAEQVVLTGWSAGGLTSILFGDYIHDRFRKSAPNLEKFRVVPISGFFIDDVKTASAPLGKASKIFKTQLLNMFEFANATGVFSPACMKRFKADFRKCGLAPHAYSYVKAPTFIVNSGVDQWQLAFLLADEKLLLDKLNLPALGDLAEFTTGEDELTGTPADDFVWENTRCMADGDCGETEVSAFHKFQDNIEDLLAKAAPKKGHGAFVHSCPSHTEALSDYWSQVEVNGVSMQQAVLNWWHSDGDHPTVKHTTTDCHLREQPPYACNPSCPEMHLPDNEA